MVWKPCEAGSLPPLDQAVLISFDGGAYCFGARIDGDEGWCWGVKTDWSNVNPAKDSCWNGIDVDDDYQPTHWHPLPSIPQPSET